VGRELVVVVAAVVIGGKFRTKTVTTICSMLKVSLSVEINQYGGLANRVHRASLIVGRR
jgi:hypothetical protein